MMRKDLSPRIAVIGAGLTGLAAAHRLGELSDERRVPVDVTVFEQQAAPGGIVGTIERDGYLIDTGADSFITNKPGALALCQRLGLSDELQSTEARFRGAHVLFRGQPVPVPQGFQLLVPGEIWPILTTPLLTPWGKLRLLFEWFLPAGPAQTDETLAHFVRRRFGEEALDRLVQPLVGGIYTSNPEELSLAATLPRYLDQERKFGSLIRAARSRKKVKSDDPHSSGARYGLFAGLKQGMGQLTAELSSRVHSRCTMRYQTGVAAVSLFKPATLPRLMGEEARFQVQLTEGEPIPFDAVIITTPAYRAARLIEGWNVSFAEALRTIDYASSAIVITGHSLSQIEHPLDSFGVVIPHAERRQILAVSFSSRKFPNRAPAGRVLLRTFVGGAMQPHLNELDDEALGILVRKELRDILGVKGPPDFTQVVRYPRGMPQYTLGHLDRVAEIERRMQSYPGLELAGNAYHGVGVPDAIASGEQAALRVFAELSAPHAPSFTAS